MNPLEKLMNMATGKTEPPAPPIKADAGEGKMQSPANAPTSRVTSENRVPMSLPRQQLEVPEIEGYVLQWFADRPGRISRAAAAGYEFVGPDEVQINNFGLAADLIQDGNTDLGSRVSIHGGVGENGASQRLYLMKIRRDWWEKDQQVIADRNESVAAAIRGGADLTRNPHEAGPDGQLRYLAPGHPAANRQIASRPNMFTPKRRG